MPKYAFTDFHEVSFEETQMSAKEITRRKSHERSAERIFGELFKVAEVGKYYKINVRSLDWEKANNYLTAAIRLYEKDAKFVTGENGKKMRVKGWVFISF
jgi:hypothetical protein